MKRDSIRSASLLVFLLMLLSLPFLTNAWQDVFELVRQRVVDELLRNPVDDARMSEIVHRMNEDGSFPDINYDDLSRTAGFPHRRHTSARIHLFRRENLLKSKVKAHQGMLFLQCCVHAWIFLLIF